MRTPIALALAAACLAAPNLSRAYVRSVATENPKVCLFWASRQVPFTLDALGSIDAGTSESLAAARLSFHQWETPSCTDFAFQDRGVSSRRTVGLDYSNRVLWRERDCQGVAPPSDSCWTSGGCNNQYDCWETDPRTIALTTVLYNTRTGEIADADIELNGADYVFTAIDGAPCGRTPSILPATCVATDVQNTLTHEIGHVIGLNHTSAVGATMFPTAPLGETSKRVLHDDDIAGMCAIYPRGKPTATCVPQDSSGQGCSSGPGGAAGLAVAPALAAALARRRRRA